VAQQNQNRSARTSETATGTSTDRDPEVGRDDRPQGNRRQQDKTRTPSPGDERLTNRSDDDPRESLEEASEHVRETETDTDEGE